MQNAKCRMQNCAEQLFNGQIVPAEFTAVFVAVDVIPLLGEMSEGQKGNGKAVTTATEMNAKLYKTFLFQ